MPVLTTLPAVFAPTDDRPPDSGAAIVRGPVARTTNATAQQSAGVALTASADPPPYDALPGRFATGRWGVVQPTQRPTPSVVAASEEPRPEAGRALRSYPRPPFDMQPTGRVAIARGDEPQTPSGRAVIGLLGFGVPPRPVKAAVVSEPAVRAPAPGGTITGAPPAAALAPQQAGGEVVVARSEEPQPHPGAFLARAFGRVPSDRYVVRPVTAWAEEARPADGRVTAPRLVLGNPPPNRPFSAVVRTEERAPEAGLVAVGRAWLELPPPARARICRAEEPPPFPGRRLAEVSPPPSLPPQQLPGRVLLAWAEAPRPEEGRTMALNGAEAGAVPPDIG